VEITYRARDLSAVGNLASGCHPSCFRFLGFFKVPEREHVERFVFVRVGWLVPCLVADSIRQTARTNSVSKPMRSFGPEMSKNAQILGFSGTFPPSLQSGLAGRGFFFVGGARYLAIELSR
jgi:hypothetical protein